MKSLITVVALLVALVIPLTAKAEVDLFCIERVGTSTVFDKHSKPVGRIYKIDKGRKPLAIGFILLDKGAIMMGNAGTSDLFPVRSGREGDGWFVQFEEDTGLMYVHWYVFTNRNKKAITIVQTKAYTVAGSLPVSYTTVYSCVPIKTRQVLTKMLESRPSI